MSILPKLQPGDLVEYSLDGYKFLALVKATIPALRRGHPVMLAVEWCGLRPKIFPGDYVPAKDVWKVRD
tara:strand:- start:744 stop:950 length:207 start_codon:yes stop_codon:yes gene_type:complete